MVEALAVKESAVVRYTTVPTGTTSVNVPVSEPTFITILWVSLTMALPVVSAEEVMVALERPLPLAVNVEATVEASAPFSAIRKRGC